MSTTNEQTDGLKALAENSQYGEYIQYKEPNPGLLERFKNPNLTSGYGEISVEIKTSEFSSLCPLTKQPDWATIIIQYAPKEWCVESKSLKLYLMGFRMHGEFHESCVDRIGNDLVRLLDPRWLQVRGEFTPRGGIAFIPTFDYDGFGAEETESFKPRRVALSDL